MVTPYPQFILFCILSSPKLRKIRSPTIPSFYFFNFFLVMSIPPMIFVQLLFITFPRITFISLRLTYLFNLDFTSFCRRSNMFQFPRFDAQVLFISFLFHYVSFLSLESSISCFSFKSFRKSLLANISCVFSP